MDSSASASVLPRAAGRLDQRPTDGTLVAALCRSKAPMTLPIPVTRQPDLHPLIEANPGLEVVIDHMADCPVDGPRKLELLRALARIRYIFWKISQMWSPAPAYPVRTPQAQSATALQAIQSRPLDGRDVLV